MCELLLGVAEIVLFIAALIDYCRPNDNGPKVSEFVKNMKRLVGISVEKEPEDVQKYRKISFLIFLLFSFLVLGFNVGELVLLYKEKENHTAISNLTYIIVSFCLFAMFLYIETAVVCGFYKKKIEDIAFHRLMLFIYHFIDTLVDLTMLIAGYHEYKPTDLAELGLMKWAFFLYSICDMVLSLLNMVLIGIFWCASGRTNSVNPTSRN